MCDQLQHRHSIHCILPPYVLDRLAQNGNAQERAYAISTRSIDSTFRALRIASQAANFAPQRMALLSEADVPQKSRSIFSAGNSQNLAGTLVRTEGQGPTGDKAVDEAYDGLGATFDFYEQVFGRNSINDEGLPLLATVHFDRGYNNAFWNSQRMVFGDGDGLNFNSFTSSLDVIGHELTHGVTEDESLLQYFNQSGALNESLSDVFGSLIKQFFLQQKADQADWLIGAGLFTAAINGKALRSMKDPGTAFDDPKLGRDPQPKHMSKFVHTPFDNGGVHINSGIPNHAFYQVASALGGFAWEKAGRIWYQALLSPQVKPNTGFRRFAGITIGVAQQLFGGTSTEAKAVRAGWGTVGIQV